jgi:hypothetical protein
MVEGGVWTGFLGKRAKECGGRCRKREVRIVEEIGEMVKVR